MKEKEEKSRQQQEGNKENLEEARQERPCSEIENVADKIQHRQADCDCLPLAQALELRKAGDDHIKKG